MKRWQQRLIALFLGAAMLLMSTVAFTYLVGLHAVRANHAIAAQQLVLHELEVAASLLKDAETGQRGFLITGEEPYLQPYSAALAELKTNFATLRRFGDTGELKAADVRHFEDLAGQRLLILDRGIETRRRQGPEAATAFIRLGEGKKVMDDLRTLQETMTRREQGELDVAIAIANKAVIQRTLAFAGTSAVNLLFLAWTYRRIIRETRQREFVTLEIARQKELISTTLGSIGDAVLVTDVEGRVTFANAEAERLTGWKSAEAAGHPLPEVFRIINEATRKPVENPVDKVLRLGTVVGLANHTILVAKDGRETPIDDSAAPIREADGPLFGVVLVFRDFTEHKEAQAALEAARAELARSNVELEETVRQRTSRLTEMVTELQHVSYAITHDMRAPLRAMNAFATVLVEESASGVDTVKVREYCGRILTGANRLDKLITDALSYTKAVLIEMPMQPVNLPTLIRGILDTYPNLHPDKADITIEGELPTVMGNESLLTQCFSNLLGNAVKFVGPGVRPQVSIRATLNDGSARISVVDNGVGIPPKAQRRLFGMFQKLDNLYEGTGIGLAIVRKVVERMGGKVGAQSEPGKGSCFWVELRVPDEPKRGRVYPG